MHLTHYLKPIRKELQSLAVPEKGRFYQGFFKTQKGGYGEGDIFLGVSVPNMRKIAGNLVKGGIFDDSLLLSISERLLQSEVHEERFLSLQILKVLYKKEYELREEIIEMYLRNLKYVNNWDLVDTSAYWLLGDWCLREGRGKMLVKMTTLTPSPSPPDKSGLLGSRKGRGWQSDDLGSSERLWRRRIAMVSTMIFLREEKFALCLKIAEILLKQQVDIDPKTERGGREGRELTNKAVGWLMRELGKRRKDLLRDFLKKYAKIMPRTMLRYMLEKMSREEKDKWMNKMKILKNGKIKKLEEKMKQEKSRKYILLFEESLSGMQRGILGKLREVFSGIDAGEVWQWNTIVWKLPSKSWWYINASDSQKLVLGCGKRKMLEKINPMISGLRDEVGKVVGKVFLFSEEDVKKKGIEELVKMSDDSESSECSESSENSVS